MTKSKFVYLDTSNLQLDAYAKQQNEISIRGVDVGIGTINEIQLAYVRIPNYLTNENSIRITLELGDVDDKIEVSKDNDDFLMASYFAKIEGLLSPFAFKMNWSKSGLLTSKHDMLNANTGFSFDVCPDESLLTNISVSLGNFKIQSDITFANGGVIFSNGTTNDSFTFLPGVSYVMTTTGLLEFVFDESSLTIEEQNEMTSYLIKDNNTYTFEIPYGKLKNTTFKIKYTDNSTEYILPYKINTSGSHLLKLYLKLDGEDFLSQTILVDTTKKVNTFGVLPYQFTKRKAPFYFNNKMNYSDTLLRIKRGSAISYSIEFVDMEFAIDKLTLRSLKHPSGTRTFTDLYSIFSMEKVEFSQIKLNDLLYTKPTSHSTISNAFNFTLKFYDRHGNDYPIYKYDDVMIALLFQNKQE